MLAAYKNLEKDQPNKVYKNVETGFEEGGQFKVPVLNAIKQ
jgi:penicillin-insensitive murein endopeptidase